MRLCRSLLMLLVLCFVFAGTAFGQKNQPIASALRAGNGAPSGNCNAGPFIVDIYYRADTDGLYACSSPGVWSLVGGGGGGGGGDALTSNPLSQFAATTSAQLAGVLTDETGTVGGFVRATGPTLNSPLIAKLANLTSNGYVKTSGSDGTLSAGAIAAADLPTAIDATKIADGSVSSTEFQFLSNVTSDIQTQLNAKQAADADLTTWAAVTPSANGQSLVAAANYAAMRALLDLEPGTDFLSFPTGTPDGSKFLRDDNTWQALAGGGDMLLGTSQTVTAAKTFNDGTLIVNGGDYGATDNSMPTGVEKGFFLNTNASSRRLFVYNDGSFRALLQAGIDVVGAASGGTGDDTSGTTGLPRVASGNWTYDAAASISDTNTGTETNKAVTPDALAGSNFGTRTAQLVVFDFATDTATGDGKYYFVVPAELNGMNLVAVSAQVVNAGTTNTLNVDLARCAVVATANMCSGTVVDVLSTNLTIDSGENKSSTAATAAVIDTANDDVATDQVIRVDVDAVHTTAAKGLIITLSFRLP